MRRFFVMTWMSLGVAAACSSSGDNKAPTPDHPAALPDPMNGQTGSPGQCGCTQDADCSGPLIQGIDSLKVPGHHDWRFVGSECARRDTNDSRRLFAHPTACLCHRVFGDAGSFVPENNLILGDHPICDLDGRSNDCLYGCKDFPECDPADASSCDATCADIETRIAKDEAKIFDAAIRTSKCSTDRCICESVIRVEDRCYAALAPGAKVYHCSLSDAAILADAYPTTYVGGGSNKTYQLDPDASNWCE